MTKKIWRVRTARRSGAEFNISLRKRRTWFADDPDKAEDAGNTSDGTGNTGSESQQENRVPYSRFQEVNAAKKAAEDELKKYKDAEEARKLKEQQDAGKFQDVINTLEPKAKRADALEATLKAYLDAEIAEVPEDMRDLIPQGDVTAQLAWVKQAKARKLFDKPKPPPLDGGRQGDGGQPAVKVTETQKTMAAIAAQHGYVVKPEDLASRQKLIEEARRRRPEKHEE